jgi:hypothetical protein
MTSIEVPDWVVRSVAGAMEDWHNNPANETGYNETLKAALTAALGAWVVPEGWHVRYKFSNDEWSQWTGYPTEEITNEVFRQISGHGATVERRTLYTLRQEKPE